MCGDGTVGRTRRAAVGLTQIQPPRGRIVEVAAPLQVGQAGHRPVPGEPLGVDQQRRGKVPVLAVVDLGAIGQRLPPHVQLDRLLVPDRADRQPRHRAALDDRQVGAVGRLPLLGGVGPFRLAVVPDAAAAERGVVQHVAAIRAAEGDQVALVGREQVVADDQVLGHLDVHAAAPGEQAVLHHVVEAVLVPPRPLHAAHRRQEVAVLPDVMVGERDVLGRVVVAVEQERVADVEDAVVDVQFRPLDPIGRVAFVARHLAAAADVGPAPAERAVADDGAGNGAQRVPGTEAGRHVVVDLRRHPQPAAPAVLLLMAVGVAAQRVQPADQVHRIAPPAEPVQDGRLAAGIRTYEQRVGDGVVEVGALGQFGSRSHWPQRRVNQLLGQLLRLIRRSDEEGVARIDGHRLAGQHDLPVRAELGGTDAMLAAGRRSRVAFGVPEQQRLLAHRPRRVSGVQPHLVQQIAASCRSGRHVQAQNLGCWPPGRRWTTAAPADCCRNPDRCDTPAPPASPAAAAPHPASRRSTGCCPPAPGRSCRCCRRLRRRVRPAIVPGEAGRTGSRRRP